MRIQKTGFYSKKLGSLAKGCRQCVRGEKLVFFVTGICPRHCYFCPINEKKYQHDVIYANERPITDISQAIEEAKLCGAEGAGFTGGDPLCRLKRTTSAIRKLKKRFGKGFHIHLYTSLDLVSEKILKKLHDAGLDEIRFHPNIDSKRLWNRIELAKDFSWDIGIEIPAIPGKLKQTKELIDYSQDKIRFLNLNQLEIADNRMSRLTGMGFRTISRSSYAVKGSEETAEKLMEYLLKKRYRIDVHYCTARLKDRIQLGERIKRRAKNIARPFDMIDDEGMLVRGAIYSKNLEKTRKELMKEFDIPEELIQTDKERKRILTGAGIIKKLKKQLKDKKLKIAIVEEYPTWDRLQVSVDYL